MITISAAQWQQLEAKRRDAFITELSINFIARFAKPGDGASLGAVKAEMRQVIALGESWGMRSTRALTQHALASRIVGLDYADALPETGSVVRSAVLDDDIKARWLELWLAALRHHQQADGMAAPGTATTLPG